MEFFLPIIFAAAIILYLVYSVYNRQNKLKLVDDEIRDFYAEKGRKVLSVSKLSMAERLKYGVPMSPYISFYYSTFSFFRIVSAIGFLFLKFVPERTYSDKKQGQAIPGASVFNRRFGNKCL
ncbi:hypothetical protein [Gaoshiqia sp. Z1-71]|uniref:hypothetical protein n=1 Tax=Gaoshiqia hydrogeniformans TaxID=3290090 RepID=UPI003BF77A1D